MESLWCSAKFQGHFGWLVSIHPSSLTPQLRMCGRRPLCLPSSLSALFPGRPLDEHRLSCCPVFPLERSPLLVLIPSHILHSNSDQYPLRTATWEFRKEDAGVGYEASGRMGNSQSQANGEETSIWMIPRSLSVPFLSLQRPLYRFFQTPRPLPVSTSRRI